MSISETDAAVDVILPDTRLVRKSRSRRRRDEPAGVFALDTPSPRPGRAASRPQAVRVVNRPARLPAMPVWPFELRADMVCADLDYRTTRELCKAIAAGDAPRPTGVRGQASAGSQFGR